MNSPTAPTTRSCGAGHVNGGHLAYIHPHRAQLFFREKPYPWKSPQADLAAAEKLINDCGYHRRDEDLADAKEAVKSWFEVRDETGIGNTNLDTSPTLGNNRAG